MTKSILEEKWTVVADTDLVPLREGKRVVCGTYELALFNLGDGYRAVDNRCPHKSGPLADGIVAGKGVFCPLHNWKIDLESGCALSGGKGQIKVYPVKVEDGKIWIDFQHGKLSDLAEQLACEITAGAVELDQ